MSAVKGVRPAGIDNAYFLRVDDEELLSTLTRFPEPGSIEHDGKVYRPWSPATSKLASMIVKGMRVPLDRRSRVLYLGAASGTTVKHVSDIAAEGIVYAVEFAPRPARDLLKAIEGRVNVVPIVADARRPERYPPFIDEVDIIYQDVAQPGQAEIAISNASRYLKSGGALIMAIKAKSISATESVGDIFRRELKKLETSFRVLEKASLEPFHHGHMAIIAEYIKRSDLQRDEVIG